MRANLATLYKQKLLSQINRYGVIDKYKYIIQVYRYRISVYLWTKIGLKHSNHNMIR